MHCRNDELTNLNMHHLIKIKGNAFTKFNLSICTTACSYRLEAVSTNNKPDCKYLPIAPLRMRKMPGGLK